jgi:chromosomal replication initiation ATPase DnaA
VTRQLSFDLPLLVSQGHDDYFVSDANRDAFAMVTGAQPWPQGKLVLTGPTGAGKSHLARLWATQGAAEVVTARSLILSRPATPPGGALVIEDLETLPAAAQEPLFHLHNHLTTTGGRLLLTAAEPPVRWPLTLPDLASRMQGTAVVRIADPDDRLLSAVLTKLFADRQIAPPPDLIDFILSRIERSFAAAAQVVAAIDAAALAEARPIGRPLVRAVLDKAFGVDG